MLRQYDESEVARSWELLLSRLAPGGLLVDGTCDELGRRSTWIALEPDRGPVSLTRPTKVSAGMPRRRAISSGRCAGPTRR